MRKGPFRAPFVWLQGGCELILQMSSYEISGLRPKTSCWWRFRHFEFLAEPRTLEATDILSDTVRASPTNPVGSQRTLSACQSTIPNYGSTSFRCPETRTFSTKSRRPKAKLGRTGCVPPQPAWWLSARRFSGRAAFLLLNKECTAIVSKV